MKSFAQENWRIFEDLTRELFKLEFKLTDNQISITSMTRDGGKDISLDFSNPTQILPTPDIKIWVETKLRSNAEEQIGLNTIAGSVVIASNNNIRSIYFVTSCYFAPQTVRELFVSSQKNGLDIFLIDGGHLRKLIEEHKQSLSQNLNKFASELNQRLPEKSQNEIQGFNFEIERGRAYEKSIFDKGIKAESKIERRIIDSDSLNNALSDKTLQLNKIKFKPIINDEEISSNPEYFLFGEQRKLLKNDIIKDLLNANAVLLTSNSGQGKTFFSNHIVRELYQKAYYAIFISINEDQNILSFTKEIISNIIGLDYFQFIEYDQLLIEHFVAYFGIEKIIAVRLIELMRHESYSDDIPVELCFNLISKLLSNINYRRKIVLVIDDFQKASNDLFRFLRNLLFELKGKQIPTLVLMSQVANSIASNDWLNNSMLITNDSRISLYQLYDLSKKDIEEYIKSLVPGVSSNILEFILKNTLLSPLYVKLFVDYLKSQKHIRTKDGNYWWLNDSALLFEKENLRDNQTDSLIIKYLKSIISDDLIKKLAIYTYLFNNNLPIDIVTVKLSVEPSKLIENPLFQVVREGDKLFLRFYHDLYYNNFYKSLNDSEKLLQYYSSEILHFFSIEDLSVQGNLYKYIGDYQKSHECFLHYADGLPKSDSFKAMLYYERSIDAYYSVVNTKHDLIDSTNHQIDIIFKLLEKYKKYNFFNNRKAPELFLLLRKFADFNQLDENSNLTYQLYLVDKLVREEDFNEAHSILKKISNIIDSGNNISQSLIDRFVIQFGINLKHIGRKDDSVIFFDKSYKKWPSSSIKYEQYSNLAAYYLVSSPQKSLEYYKKMEVDLKVTNSLHLTIDFGMAYFYMKEYEKARYILNEAVRIARNKINLAEEARAENIIGLLLWESNYLLAQEYLELAHTNAELANNHRWIWRIRTNLAQLAYINNSFEKAYNISWAVVEHLIKTKTSLIYEINNSKNSRRFAALKAIIQLFHLLQKESDVEDILKEFRNSVVNKFAADLIKNNSNEFDNDTNRFGPWYYILG
jgi:hypothetical protein